MAPVLLVVVVVDHPKVEMSLEAVQVALRRVVPQLEYARPLAMLLMDEEAVEEATVVVVEGVVDADGEVDAVAAGGAEEEEEEEVVA